MKKDLFSEDYYRNSPGYPSQTRIEQGPVAVIECNQDIPCNPCETVCRFGAIKVGQPITNLPRLFEDKCTGCGRCVPVCPGMAIFLLHRNFTEKEACLTVPYEFLPVPEKNEEIECLDRKGRNVCPGRVIRVVRPEKNQMTALITFSFPKKFCHKVRSFKQI